MDTNDYRDLESLVGPVSEALSSIAGTLQEALENLECVVANGATITVETSGDDIKLSIKIGGESDGRDPEVFNV